MSDKLGQEIKNYLKLIKNDLTEENIEKIFSLTKKLNKELPPDKKFIVLKSIYNILIYKDIRYEEKCPNNIKIILGSLQRWLENYY